MDNIKFSLSKRIVIVVDNPFRTEGKVSKRRRNQNDHILMNYMYEIYQRIKYTQRTQDDHIYELYA